MSLFFYLYTEKNWGWILDIWFTAKNIQWLEETTGGPTYILDEIRLTILNANTIFNIFTFCYFLGISKKWHHLVPWWLTQLFITALSKSTVSKILNAMIHIWCIDKKSKMKILKKNSAFKIYTNHYGPNELQLWPKLEFGTYYTLF